MSKGREIANAANGHEDLVRLIDAALAEERARGLEEGMQALDAEARYALLHFPEDIFPPPSLAHGDEPRDLCTAAAVRHVVPVLVEGVRARAARIREGKR